jgi:hypothetical protein
MRKPGGRLRGHIDEQDAGVLAPGDPVNGHTARWRDDLTQKLPVPVHVDKVTRHRAYLIQDLCPVLGPGGDAHHQHAAGFGVGERSHVFDQLGSLGGVIQLVYAGFRVQPPALGEAEQLPGLPVTQRCSHLIDPIDPHPSSIAASRRRHLPRDRDHDVLFYVGIS